MTTIVMESKYKRERLLAVLTSRQVWRGCLTYPPSIIHNVCTHPSIAMGGPCIGKFVHVCKEELSNLHSSPVVSIDTDSVNCSA